MYIHVYVREDICMFICVFNLHATKVFVYFFILISRRAEKWIKNTQVLLYRYSYFQEIYRVSLLILNIIILKINTLKIRIKSEGKKEKFIILNQYYQAKC